MKTRFELPNWINAETWKHYIEMRKKLKRPMTEHAMELAVMKLNSLARQGNDPNEVLEQSIFNGYQGLFPVRRDLSPRGDAYVGQGPQLTEAQMERVRERIAARKQAN